MMASHAFTRVVEELVFNCLDDGVTKVLLFIEEVVVNLWAESNPAVIPVKYEVKKERCKVPSCRATLGLPSLAAKETDWRVYCQDGKCLYLGTDDCRQDVGTAVIVHDVFTTNQFEGSKCTPDFFHLHAAVRMTCFEHVLLLLRRRYFQWVWDSSELP